MKGFLSDISTWWLIPAALFSGVVAYFYYRKSQKQDGWNRSQFSILASLRGLGIFLLLLLLFGLIWESVSYREEKPLVVTVIDDSASMLNYSDSAKVKPGISKLKQQLKSDFGDKFDLVFLTIAEKTALSDSVSFNGAQTNLAAPFDYIRETWFNRNIGAVVLVSDGNFNEGNHPMYAASELELTPVFTLGVGDTATRRDQLVRSVNSNEVAFLNNQFPIEATVDFNRIPAGPAKITLSQDGKAIASQTVQCRNSFSDQADVLFTVDAKEKGFHRYTVAVEHKSGEYTFANNQQTVYVEIIDNKGQIVLLTDAPHPDIAAIRSVLEENKQTKVSVALTSSWKLPAVPPDMVFWYENGSHPNPALMNNLKQARVPVFFILGPATSPNVFKSYDLGISLIAGAQQDDVQASVSPGFTAFDFSSDFTDVLKDYPPLRVKFARYQLAANAEVVLNQRVGNIVKQDPLLVITHRGDVKTAILLGEGLWRWKIREFSQKKDIAGFREFVDKMVQYLSVQQTREPLRVTLPRHFSVVDEVEFKAEFYNAAMELITTPKLELLITSEKGEKTRLDFAAVSNFFRSNAGQLKPGTYTWQVTAQHNGKVYKKSGSFVVEDISLEKLSTRSSFDVLNQLSVQSDGKFYPLAEYGRFLNELKTRSDIGTVRFADSGFTALIDWKWLALLLVVVFGTEWFLRRFWGSY